MAKIQEVAMDFMQRNDCNFYAIDLNFELKFFGYPFHPESIWYSEKEDKIYLHGGNEEFEGDIDIDSLSESNQSILEKALKTRI